MLNVKNGKIILEAIKVLGKNPILNILRFFDVDKKCLVNGNVHLISVDKGTFYTNGKSIMLKANINNQVTNFCFNGRPLPYCKIYNKELLIWAQDLYTLTMNNNPDMARKYKCVQWIMNNYLDVFYFFINAKEINTTSIKHPNTRQYVENSFLPKDKQVTTPTDNQNKELTTNKNIASSINSKQNNKQMLNIEARKNVMSITHNTRRKWEAQYPNFKALPYKERLQIALSKVWKAIKDSEIKAKESMITKDEQQSNTNNISANNKVIDINSKKQNTNLIANNTNDTNTTTINNKYNKRIQGKMYVVFHPGLITLEDYQGKVINQIDFRGKLYNQRTGKTYDQVGVDPMKRFYIRTQMERAGQNVIIVLDKDDEIFTNDVDKSKYSCIYE